MNKVKDLPKLEERYPNLNKENHNFTLAVPDTNIQTHTQDEVYAALGETPEGKDKRYVQKYTAEGLIAQAIDGKASVETVERIIAMARELRLEQAKYAYDQAMAGFQAECPTIVKTKEVRTNSGGIAYRYAPIESIVEQVKHLTQKYGFSYAFTMELLENGVKVVCRVTHASGHSEDSPMEVPFGNKTNVMSQTQVVAAAQTFAKRYAFCNAFGILTGDEDNDGGDVPENRRIAPQKAQQALVNPPEVHPAKNVQIVTLLNKLGIGAATRSGYEVAVKDLTDLPLTEDNFDEIIARLSIRVQEAQEYGTGS